MSEEPASTLYGVAEASHLWRALQSFTRAWAVAWDGSWVGGLVVRSAVLVRQATPAGRLRAAASVVAWACVWHVAGLTVLPRYVTSGLPRVWFIGAGVAALLVALAADRFARAWGTSTLCRALNRFAS